MVFDTMSESRRDCDPEDNRLAGSRKARWLSHRSILMTEARKSRPSGGYRSIRAKAAAAEPVDIGRDLVAFVSERLERHLRIFTDHLRQLQDVMAGRAKGKSFEDARRRLQNLKLKTTYVAERQRALAACRIELRRDLAAWLPRLIAAAAELEFVETCSSSTPVRALHGRSISESRDPGGLGLRPRRRCPKARAGGWC
jgi:hypothetical protein